MSLDADRGFAPILGANPRVLILGSMPGQVSLDTGQYYAHPRNAFWPIMAELFGFDPGLSYAERERRLTDKGVAVWDVLASCVRPGSLDSAIDRQTIEVNEFSALFRHQTEFTHLFFNGATAETLYERHVYKKGTGLHLTRSRLPSTSPAHASLSFESKLTQWRAILDALN